MNSTLPLDATRFRCVKNFSELVTTSFADGVNALCWERTLPGAFAEVVERLDADDGITTLDEARLRRLNVSTAGKRAIDVMLEDLRLLREQGLAPELNCIRSYPRDETSPVAPIDVYSFHADSAPVSTDTWLCTYYGAPSEGLHGQEARRRVDDPAARAELLKLFGGNAGEAFDEFVKENCHDLHYVALSHARPFSFGVGNLWRIAVDYPGCPVPPCIHRAPATLPDHPPRLLLIS